MLLDEANAKLIKIGNAVIIGVPGKYCVRPRTVYLKEDIYNYQDKYVFAHIEDVYEFAIKLPANWCLENR